MSLLMLTFSNMVGRGLEQLIQTVNIHLFNHPPVGTPNMLTKQVEIAVSRIYYYLLRRYEKNTRYHTFDEPSGLCAP